MCVCVYTIREVSILEPCCCLMLDRIYDSLYTLFIDYTTAAGTCIVSHVEIKSCSNVNEREVKSKLAVFKRNCVSNAPTASFGSTQSYCYIKLSLRTEIFSKLSSLFKQIFYRYLSKICSACSIRLGRGKRLIKLSEDSVIAVKYNSVSLDSRLEM